MPELSAHVRWLLNHPLQTIFEWRDGTWVVVGYKKEAMTETPQTAESFAIREYVDATIAEADIAAEVGIGEPGEMFPLALQDAKRRVNNAYEDLHALATDEHTQRCGIWYELDDVTGILHAIGTCDCILSWASAPSPCNQAPTDAYAGLAIDGSPECVFKQGHNGPHSWAIG